MASMNDLMRYGGRGVSTGKMASPVTTAGDGEAKGSRDFTVQAAGELSPTDQFIYEPYEEGAWVVYPPGVPCDSDVARISRATPAGAGDFDKMQAALDEMEGEKTPDT